MKCQLRKHKFELEGAKSNEDMRKLLYEKIDHIKGV